MLSLRLGEAAEQPLKQPTNSPKVTFGQKSAEKKSNYLDERQPGFACETVDVTVAFSTNYLREQQTFPEASRKGVSALRGQRAGIGGCWFL